ncbi:flagellar hook-associated protein FlgK [Maritimibacter sp. 55A14]|uniref:flagellar hook-associated protein FlgK n=1 Tax=Maritimibacter sp. 55A14 TaxID=2174844 RepID=UPI000D60C09F|nr:flagellar hook-associated protein FlgK [Maritimibacter sp. 55A14]PWE33445.1 flagellar hook-associated protein FlgK [Maritimibacter sp. 55A14]
MSFSTALSNALSGLTATTRTINAISSNVANASTPGYGRREVLLSSLAIGGLGGGVRVDGVARITDQAAIADRRAADAALGDAALRTDFLARVEDVTGIPGSGGSLSDRFTTLEVALVDAAGRPDQPSRLIAIRDAAVALVGQFNRISDDIQAQRAAADAGIARQVSDLNGALARVADLNSAIRARQGAGTDTGALADERQRLIDGISSIVPVRAVARDGAQIALYTTTGAALVDGSASRLDFSPAGFIDPAMTLAGGALSGLALNGKPVATSGERATFAGGALAANFALRDDLAVSANAGLDALARDLIERFADPGVDPTLAPGAPGLFTDAGAAFVVGTEPGLAGRIAFSVLADPASGGDVARLRDGLGAAAPGPVGNSAQLTAIAAALAAPRVPASGGFGGIARSAPELAADFLSRISTARQAAETDRSFAAARQQAFTAEELRAGVDTDQELQTLLVAEQAFAANARVLQTIDDMMATLLRI